MTRAADDYDAIGKRLREIQAARPAPDGAVCHSCAGIGWVANMTAFGGTSFAPCFRCGNPEGRPCP